MNKRYCPYCGGELNNLNEQFGNKPDNMHKQLFNCPTCELIYFVKDSQLVRMDIEEDDDYEEENYDEDEALQQNEVTAQNQLSADSADKNGQQQKKTDGFSKASNKLTKKIIIMLCVFAVISVALFVTGLLVKAISAWVGVVLFLFGFGLIIYAVVLGITLPKKARQICPACGNKREHHRRFTHTTNKVNTINSSNGQQLTTKYTHHYIDTYTCPNCGETAEYETTENGGETIIGGQYGRLDKRKNPREF